MLEPGLDGTTQNPRVSERETHGAGESGKRFVFGTWMFDPETGELWGDPPEERPTLLRPQLKTLLKLLTERPGRLVPRAEIHRALWGETIVDLDRGLNFCVRQLREILGDDARRPTYIETLPRRGYRFVAQVAIEQTGDVYEHEPAIDGDRVEPRPASTSEPSVGTAEPKQTSSGAKRASVTGPLILAVLAGILMTLAAGRWLRVEDEVVELPDPDFREALETGRLLMDRGFGSLDRAEQSLVRAVTLAPDSAEAWAELSKLHLLMTEKDAERSASAKAAFTRALELDPHSPLAHVRAGDFQSLHDFDWPAAEVSFRRALELDPNHVEALHRLAFAFSIHGNDEEAMAAMQRARALDPMSTLLVGDTLVLHLLAGRFDAAEELSRKVIELRPEAKSLRVMRVFLLEKLERWPEAGEAARNVALDGYEAVEPTGADDLRTFWHLRLEELSREAGATPRLARAGIHAHLGDRSAALDDLEAVAASGSLFLPFQLRDPRFEILHEDPRFRSVLEKVGLGGVPWGL